MIELRSNQHPIRMVIFHEITPSQLREARRQRQNVMSRLWYAKNRNRVRAEAAARRLCPEVREQERQRKARWRAANRDQVNAYYRRYYQLNPARRQYLASKKREYRARARALKEA